MEHLSPEYVELDAEYALRAMLFSESIGSYTSVKSQISRNGWKFLKTQCANLSEQYRLLGDRVSIAFAYENTYGLGSLLRLDHPSVVKLLKLGMVGKSEISAATARQHCPIKMAINHSAVQNPFVQTPMHPDQCQRRLQ